MNPSSAFEISDKSGYHCTRTPTLLKQSVFIVGNVQK